MLLPHGFVIKPAKMFDGVFGHESNERKPEPGTENQEQEHGVCEVDLLQRILAVADQWLTEVPTRDTGLNPALLYLENEVVDGFFQ